MQIYRGQIRPYLMDVVRAASVCGQAINSVEDNDLAIVRSEFEELYEARHLQSLIVAYNEISSTASLLNKTPPIREGLFSRDEEEILDRIRSFPLLSEELRYLIAKASENLQLYSYTEWPYDELALDRARTLIIAMEAENPEVVESLKELINLGFAFEFTVE